MTASTFLVGMAEIHAAKGTAKYTCLGLGSCIGLCALDPHTHISAVAHIMLPEAFPGKDDKPGKFANTAVPEMLSMLERLGASKHRLVWALAGGAQVFKFGAESGSRLDVGVRNAAAVDVLMKKFGLRVIGADTGGNLGRTVLLDTDSGIVTVRTVSQGEKMLCKLRG